MTDSDDSVELEDLRHGPARAAPKKTPGRGVRAYAEIIEQPQSRGIRFRYKSEGPSHGGLQGESSARGKKTSPSIKVHNYEGLVMIFVSLVTDQNPPQPHAHELVGKNCQDGKCIYEIRINRAMNITFPNLSIQHVTKKSVIKTLEKRIYETRYPYGASVPDLPDSEKKAITEEAKKQAEAIQMNVVRLQFQVILKHDVDRQDEMLPPVYSQPIYDSKCPAAAALKICRMDRQAGCCRGYDEIFLLCDKVQKDDIQVRFYEENSAGVVVWENNGNFSPSDVHRQYAIVFTTPPYRDNNIQEPVDVKLQLFRPSDEEKSEAKSFTYYPQRDKEEIQRKRRKKIQMPTYNENNDSSNARIKNESPNGVSGDQRHSPSATANGYPMGRQNNHRQNGSPSRQTSILDTDVVADGCVMTERPARPVMGHRFEKPELVGVHRVDPFFGMRKGVKAENDVGCQTENLPEEELKQRYSKDYRGSLAYNIAERSTTGLLQYAVTADVKSLLYVQRYLLGVKDEDGDTPLYIAIVNKNKEVANGMIEVLAGIQDADFVNQKNSDGQTAVHLAVIHKQYDVFDRLLEYNADPSIQDRDGNTVAHIIAIENDHKSMDILLKYRNKRLYKDNVVDMSWANKKNMDGLTPLHLAIRCQSLHCVRALLKAGIDPNVEDSKSGRSPLHLCAEVDNIGILGYLMTESHPDVNAKDYDGLTPLHIACSRGSVSMVALLMTKGADPLAESSRTWNNQKEGDVSAPVEEGSTEEPREDARGETPMDIAKDLKDADRRNKLVRILKGETYAAVSSIAKGMKEARLKIEDVWHDIPPIECVYSSLLDLGVQVLPQGDIVSLGFGTRLRLAQVLDKDEHRGWKALAKQIELDALIEPLAREKSPTLAMLDNYEVIDGTIEKLRNALKKIKRDDLVKVLNQALEAKKNRLKNASGPMSLDAGYASVQTDKSGVQSLSTGKSGVQSLPRATKSSKGKTKQVDGSRKD